MNADVIWVGAWLLTAGVATAAVHLIRRWAIVHRVFDVPNDRSSHRIPTPRGGGLAIYAIVSLGVILAWYRKPFWTLTQLCLFILAGSIVAFVSLIDDLRPLPSVARLAAHVIAGAVTVYAFPVPSRIELTPALAVNSPVASAVLALVWIVGLTNAYNFMDGIDAIAGAQAFVAGVVWLAAALFLPDAELLWLGFFISATAAGFLLYNRPPALIFMGDVGSAFLGFGFALAGLLYARRREALSLLICLPVWPFVFDATLTFFRRAWRRERIFEAHRSHLYQRLVIAGWSHGSVSLLFALAALAGGVALFLPLPASTKAIVGICTIAVGGFLLWLITARAERAMQKQAA